MKPSVGRVAVNQDGGFEQFRRTKQTVRLESRRCKRCPLMPVRALNRVSCASRDGGLLDLVHKWFQHVPAECVKQHQDVGDVLSTYTHCYISWFVLSLWWVPNFVTGYFVGPVCIGLKPSSGTCHFSVCPSSFCIRILQAEWSKPHARSFSSMVLDASRSGSIVE